MLFLGPSFGCTFKDLAFDTRHSFESVENVESAHECIRICNLTSECQSFSYNDSETCFLTKRKVEDGAIAFSKGFVSGSKSCGKLNIEF